MVFLGKNLNMNIVASIGYSIEVVGKEGQGVYMSSGQSVENGETTCIFSV